MIRDELSLAITQAVKEKYDVKLEAVEVSEAQPGFGDYAANVAFGLAKTLGRPPREIAAELAPVIKHPAIARAEAAGAGYINFDLSDAALVGAALAATKPKPAHYQGQVVVTEYSDPNPFKVLHVGHLYTTVIGDAISNLVRLAGGEVHAVNFGGDVGLHVAKAMWAILAKLGGEKPEALEAIEAGERSEWMAACYVEGTRAYDEDEAVKADIMALNKQIYQITTDGDRDTPLAQIYWTCRQWSYDYFEAFYARVGSKFEKYYPESETAPIGLAKVKEELAKGVYQKSDGAVIFDGEPYGLHTRVFITSQGLPTYETKDLGSILAKWADYHFDRYIVITGSDIIEYMKVVFKSLEQFEPELAAHSIHITHGNVKLAGGVKMSSREGNFLRAVDVLDLAAGANAKANGKTDDDVTLGAVKYSFVKSRIGTDISFVPEDSVSLEGNSGPYLQYAHARARSILAKAQEASEPKINDLQAGERLLVVKLMEFTDVIDRSVAELRPHYIATYLYELAQAFNRFYETNRVVGDSREGVRLELVRMYATILKQGLQILGIKAPDRL